MKKDIMSCKCILDNFLESWGGGGVLDVILHTKDSFDRVSFKSDLYEYVL